MVVHDRPARRRHVHRPGHAERWRGQQRLERARHVRDRHRRAGGHAPPPALARQRLHADAERRRGHGPRRPAPRRREKLPRHRPPRHRRPPRAAPPTQRPPATPAGRREPDTPPTAPAAPRVPLTPPATPSSKRSPSFTGTASDTTTVTINIYEGESPTGPIVSTATAAGGGGA